MRGGWSAIDLTLENPGHFGHNKNTMYFFLGRCFWFVLLAPARTGANARQDHIKSENDMKIKFLAAAWIAALFAGAAHAQTAPQGAATEWQLNPGGIGHALVIPYFSTQNGNSTLVNIGNATGVDKIVKVHIRGAANGDDLFNFQIFLKGRDMWTMNLSTGENGIPVITTSDTSCTLPVTINGQELRAARLSPTLPGDALANHTREGYIEIINMGDADLGSGLYSFWQPPECGSGALSALTRFDSRLSLPTTGLYANWTIINVPRTTTWSGEATAWEARANGVASTGNGLYFPQSETLLRAAEVAAFSADPLFKFAAGAPIVAATESDLPDLSTPSIPGFAPQAQANALSHTMAWTEMLLEYLVDPAIGAATDLVFSMPSRRYYTAMDYEKMQPVSNRSTHGEASAVYFVDAEEYPRVPFECQKIETWMVNDRAGNPLRYYGGIVFTGSPPPALLICGAVSVMQTLYSEADFSPSRTLSASVTRTGLPQTDEASDGQITVNTGPWLGQGPSYPQGLPAIGRSFMKAENPNARQGVSGTFGGTFSGRIVQPGAAPQ
jgi:hypothetical protein